MTLNCKYHNAFDQIINKVFAVVFESGLDVGERSVSNSSLRSSTFNMQEDLSIDGVMRQSISGHVSDVTSIQYLRFIEKLLIYLELKIVIISRGNVERSWNMGKEIIEDITGVKCIPVDFTAVYLRNGAKVYPMRCIPPAPGL